MRTKIYIACKYFSLIIQLTQMRNKAREMTPILTDLPAQGLFTWSGGPRSSGVGFFCFHALEDTKQKKPTPLDLGPPLHVNIVLMFLFLLPENCQYPFVPLFRLLNVFVGTYFLVYDLLTPFSYACLKLIYIAEKTDPQSGCLFILLRLSSQQILIFHILSNCQPIRTAKLLAFSGIILLVRYFLDSTTIHDL